jgi:hypothetical protein
MSVYTQIVAQNSSFHLSIVTLGSGRHHNEKNAKAQKFWVGSKIGPDNHARPLEKSVFFGYRVLHEQAHRMRPFSTAAGRVLIKNSKNEAHKILFEKQN